MHRADAGVEPLLLGGVDDFLRGALALALRDELGERRILRRGRLRQRMIGRQRHELRPEQGVAAGGENVELALAAGRGLGPEREADLQPLGAADPVRLHQAHLLRPARERIERGEQLVGVRRDREVPLHHLALLDLGARAPAAAVDHLLVGEHGLVDRIPVDLAELALDQPGLEEVEEHLLLVLVVGGVAGRDLARPVERQPHRAQLRLHRLDVLVGPGARMHLALDRGVLRRHAEGVPAHGMQHGEAARALVARDHVAHGVVAHVAHVDAPGGIGEHLEDVVFVARAVVGGRRGAGRGHGVIRRREDAGVVPFLLPARLRLAGVVAVLLTVLGHQNQRYFGRFGRPD